MRSYKELERALNQMGYHKTDAFIKRCKLESYGSVHADLVASEVIREVSYSMLDRDLEAELFNRLGI